MAESDYKSKRRDPIAALRYTSSTLSSRVAGVQALSMSLQSATRKSGQIGSFAPAHTPQANRQPAAVSAEAPQQPSQAQVWTSGTPGERLVGERPYLQALLKAPEVSLPATRRGSSGDDVSRRPRENGAGTANLRVTSEILSRSQTYKRPEVSEYSATPATRDSIARISPPSSILPALSGRVFPPGAKASQRRGEPAAPSFPNNPSWANERLPSQPLGGFTQPSPVDAPQRSTTYSNPIEITGNAMAPPAPQSGGFAGKPFPGPAASNSSTNTDTLSGASAAGDLYLDGHVLGRWITGHLERTLTRPTLGTTAFDRQTITPWPGLPLPY